MNECIAKLHPDLLSTDFLWPIYGGYECINPLWISSWPSSPLILCRMSPNSLTPCCSAAFSEPFSLELAPMTCHRQLPLRAPSAVQYKACLLSYHILGLVGERGPWVGWHGASLKSALRKDHPVLSIACDGSEGHLLESGSEYILTYSFWREKKKKRSMEQQSLISLLGLEMKLICGEKSDVTQALRMCLQPGINCLTPLVIYSLDAIPSSSALGYCCCDTRARHRPRDLQQQQQQLCCVCRSHSNCALLSAGGNRPCSLPLTPPCTWTWDKARERPGAWAGSTSNLPLQPRVEWGWWDRLLRPCGRLADTGWMGSINSQCC